MLDLQTEYWKTLKAPFAPANEFIPIHIGALSTFKGVEFAETLMDLSDCIMHQNSFYPVTVAAVPHLVRLLDERSDSPEESAQLLSVLGNAVACEAEDALAAAASATDFPIVEWYHASLVRGESLINKCIDRHAAVWN